MGIEFIILYEWYGKDGYRLEMEYVWIEYSIDINLQCIIKLHTYSNNSVSCT